MAAFQTMPPSGRPFLSFDQGAIDILEGISSAEKAQAVPFVRMWQVNPKTGDPVHGKDGVPTGPLSLESVSPPAFGRSLDDPSQRFRERPPVSLVQVNVKCEAPRGVITYRVVTIEFMVHRPDVLFFSDDSDTDRWVNLLLPGNVFAMEYGWRTSGGVRNELLNGEGYVNRQVDPPVVVPGAARVKFTVTNYSFKILPDMQFQVTVTGFEDGEFSLRNAVLGAEKVREKPEEPGNRLTILPPLEAYNEEGLQVVERLQKLVGTDLKAKADAKGNVRFGDLCDILFADTIDAAFRDLGYSPPSLYIGYFNERVGTPSERYGNQDMSGKPIADFVLPMRDVEQVFISLLKTGDQLTLYNFIRPFLELVQDSRTWDRKNSKIDKDGSQKHTLPQLMIRSITNKKDVIVYIFDIRREFTKFADSDRMTKEELLGGDYTRSRVREILRNKGVPLISFQRGNSYIAESDFEVINDDQVKSILMRQYLRPTRKDVVDVSKKLKEKTAVDPRQVLYSSAIHGTISMLGNHVFDVFGLVWLEFTVPVWDGPFYILGREDVINQTGFFTTITFNAAGTDPLGTQGRPTLNSSGIVP